MDAFGHNAGLSSQLNDNNSAYQKALKKSMEQNELSKNAVSPIDAGNAKINRENALTEAQKALSASF